LVSICANLVNIRLRSGVGCRNTQADQREYVGFGALTFGSEYLRTVTLPTSRRVAGAVLVLLGAAGLGALAGTGAGPLAGAGPSPRPSFAVTERAVVPAAHCVSDGAGHWATHWTFVPGYTDGREPYGSYPAQTYYVPARWSAGADEDDDVAFVVVGTARGHKVGGAVGGQPIEFGWRAPAEAVFGYPSEPPYTGRSLDYCQGTLQPDPFGTRDEGIACAMTEGGSGGPWLSDFDPRTGLGVITGVTTFRYSGQDRILYSADLGPVAQALYKRASSL
jgi:hypothetical protein